MFKRKELAQAARKNLKKHYWLFVAVCLFAAFIGSEFTETMEAFRNPPSVSSELGSNQSEGAAFIETNVDNVSNTSVID